MNTNDEVKVFAQVGLMKEPKWLRGTLLEAHFPESGYLVQTSGNKIWSDKVKRYERLVCKDGIYPAVIEFENKHWNSLKNFISDAMSKFFPNEKLIIKEEEKIISACDEVVTINSGITEVESIASFAEHPVWEVQTWHSIPSTRWEPGDVDCKLIGNAFSSLSGAKIFVDAVWSVHSDCYWTSLEENNSIFDGDF